MKNLLKYFIFVLMILILQSCGEKSASKRNLNENEISSLNKTVNSFAGKIRSSLISHMQKGGVTDAVSVCSDSAQLITKTFAQNENVEIKRVSNKFRNPLNKPDEFEKEILQKFETLSNEGKLNPESYEYKIVKENGKEFVRFMKPIVIQQACLNCHGDENQVQKNIAEVINKKYQNDLARNYKVGDLRGAFSMKKEL